MSNSTGLPSAPESARVDRGALVEQALLRTEDLTVHFPIRSGLFGTKQVVHALDEVSIGVRAGETLGIVGESGSGKTTLGYAALGQYAPTSGRVWFDGVDVTGYRGRKLRALRRDIQMIYQDPYGSLNPRMSVEEIVAEPLIVHEGLSVRELRERVAELLEMCGFPATTADRFPGAFSGGQRQRIVIARALALQPRLIVADEPTSALDVSIQAQIVNLMRSLQERLNVAYLFISHDLAVVRHLSHRIAVLYLGKVVESAPAGALFEAPLHPYTSALISAAPSHEPAGGGRRERILLSGDIPTPVDPPSGCRFRTRCPIAIDRCREEVPAPRELAPGHVVACHRPGELQA
jgi:oligopeptide/dipeptide ABC transporter ATP-binding protein